ncbi:MAG TPA: acyltransferase [Ktedonobacterales bacterium]|nr:acyltransferase [Ktedonobacterales bacterium]
MNREGRKSLDALTGARFLAAFWVLVYHFAIQFRFDRLPGKPPSSRALPLGLGPVILQGHLAVDFFFILSGFILAYTYAASEGGMRGSRREFWVARIARIYPVYLLGLALGLAQFLSTEHNLAIVAISGFTHLFMLHALFPVGLEWNQPSWSLGVEAFFYAFFPLALLLAGRLRRRGLWLLFFASWLVFIGIDLGLVMMTRNGFTSLPGWRDIARYDPLVSFPEFIAGMALGLLFTRYGASALPLLRRLTAPLFDVLIIVTLAAYVGVLFVAARLDIRSTWVDALAPVSLPPLAAIILLLAFQRGMIVKLLSHPLIVWLGEISYAVYILHKPVWYLLSAPLWTLLSAISMATVGHVPSNTALIIAFTVLVVLIAGLSFQFLERPLRRAIRARWGRPQSAEPIPVFPNMLRQALAPARRDQQG